MSDTEVDGNGPTWGDVELCCGRVACTRAGPSLETRLPSSPPCLSQRSPGPLRHSGLSNQYDWRTDQLHYPWGRRFQLQPSPGCNPRYHEIWSTRNLNVGQISTTIVYGTPLVQTIGQIVLSGTVPLKTIRNNFHSCTVHLDAIKSFIYPTDAQLDSSKRMSKFTLKFTLKILLHISV